VAAHLPLLLVLRTWWLLPLDPAAGVATRQRVNGHRTP
jgi:hypothetical protein